MSLNPNWFSTIFGVYIFAGCVLSILSTLVLLGLWCRGKGVLADAISLEHYHDLGKWMFAFTFFWGYIAFSQYMLIWYANMPEETQWFLPRQVGPWLWVSTAAPVLPSVHTVRRADVPPYQTPPAGAGVLGGVGPDRAVYRPVFTSSCRQNGSKQIDAYGLSQTPPILHMQVKDLLASRSGCLQFLAPQVASKALQVPDECPSLWHGPFDYNKLFRGHGWYLPGRHDDHAFAASRWFR